MSELSFAERFNGPPGSANGGYACGSIAELLGGEVEVTLRRPPLLGQRLRLRVSDSGGAVVHDGDDLIAEARPATVALGVPGGASLAEAQEAAERSPLYQNHAYPTCFTCGPDRAPATGCGSFPARCPAATCGRRRGRPTPRSPTRTAW